MSLNKVWTTDNCVCENVFVIGQPTFKNSAGKDDLFINAAIARWFKLNLKKDYYVIYWDSSGRSKIILIKRIEYTGKLNSDSLGDIWVN